jgi:hypothetical protein
LSDFPGGALGENRTWPVIYGPIVYGPIIYGSIVYGPIIYGPIIYRTISDCLGIWAISVRAIA